MSKGSEINLLRFKPQQLHLYKLDESLNISVSLFPDLLTCYNAAYVTKLL